jgi:hypothetical protein
VENTSSTSTPAVSNLGIQDQFSQIGETHTPSEIDTTQGDNISIFEKSSGILQLFLQFN